MTGLDRLNALSDSKAIAAFLRCCGATRWAREMALRRPFASVEALHGAAAETWRSCTRDDVLEAFAAHPRIGDRAPASSWSSDEQAGVHAADTRQQARLAAANDAYVERFGYIFLICAEGRGASEMLDQLETRLSNDPHDELRVAAREQALITARRLDKLLAELESA